MYNHNDQFPHPETTCGSLLAELQAIWDEVGELESERDKMLLQLEQECLEAYRRKVDQASHIRAQLRQAVAESEAEIALICATLGERPIRLRKVEQNTVSLKKELEVIMPELEEMRKRKIERRNRFVEVLNRLNILSKEIHRSEKENEYMRIIDESDLSLKRLEELQNQICVLEKEKSDRLNLMLENLNILNSLCVVLGVDFKHTIKEIQPTLDDSNSTKNIHSDTIEKLCAAISSFKEVKMQRIQKLQDFAGTMVELWTLMDTPFEEQKPFHNVTRHIAASENEFTEPNILSLDFIGFAEAEVLRLQQMKSRKMKEVILKKWLDLDELCRKAHMVAEAHNAMDHSVEAIESGTIDPSDLLEQIELWISKVKEEAFSRKDILERVEKWLSACEEECWLEEYSRDDNRYNGGRGTHLMLKRAEKARVVVNKIPAMVDALTSKTRAWEEDRRTEFLYDGVRLISMLEQYNILKQEKEQERQRQRDQKRLFGQLVTEEEVLFGSKPSPVKSGKKVSRKCTGDTMSKRFTHVGVVLQTPPNGKITMSSHRKSNSVKQNSLRILCAPSSGKKTLGITSLTAAPHSSFPSTAHVAETTPARKALSPVSSPYTLKVKAAGNTPVQNVTNNVVIPRTPPSNKSPVATPERDENRTPKTMPIPMPNTRSTVLVGMQTAPTTAPPFVPHEVEYSFEEKRAGVLS